jgi:hypothetical protein
MRITRAAIDDAVAAGVLGESQAAALWSFLSVRDAETPSGRGCRAVSTVFRQQVVIRAGRRRW